LNVWATFDALVAGYRRRGVVVDTNLLLLHVVGEFGIEWISKLKRTRMYSGSDFELVRRFIQQFETVWTTPTILAEVNSLSLELRGTDFAATFAGRMQLLLESYSQSKQLSLRPEFRRFGLTDCSITRLAARAGRRRLVVTDDLELATELGRLGVDVVNINHLRSQEWFGKPEVDT
jgi:rRNA-processing protein FCF1